MEGLDITSLLADGGEGVVLYDLSAVVCHSGTLDVGHYVVYLRRLCSSASEAGDCPPLDLQRGTPSSAGSPAEQSGEPQCEWVR